MIDPSEIINREEITVTLNGREAVALVDILINYTQRGLATPFQAKHIHAFLLKLRPGINEKDAKQKRLKRDGLN
jgi:hypothetical protein